MANICENKYYITCDNSETLDAIANKLDQVFGDRLDGEITYLDESFLEGYFDSKWSFLLILESNVRMKRVGQAQHESSSDCGPATCRTIWITPPRYMKRLANAGDSEQPILSKAKKTDMMI